MRANRTMGLRREEWWGEREGEESRGQRRGNRNGERTRI